MNPKLRERILQETVSPLFRVNSKSLPSTPRSVRRAPTPIDQVLNRSNSTPELPSINGNKTKRRNRSTENAKSSKTFELKNLKSAWNENLSDAQNNFRNETFLRTSAEKNDRTDRHTQEFWESSGSPEWTQIFKSLSLDNDSFLPTLTKEKVRRFNFVSNHRESLGESTTTTTTTTKSGENQTERPASLNENKLITLSIEPLTKSNDKKISDDTNHLDLLPPSNAVVESDVNANGNDVDPRLWEWLSVVNREISSSAP